MVAILDDVRVTPIVSPKSMRTAVYDQLSDLIQELALPPGSRLIEADLSAQLHVSKTPVREAFLMLEQDQLVERVPNVGVTVTWLTLEGYSDGTVLLDAIEGAFLPKVVARICQTQVDELSAIAVQLAHARASLEGRWYRDLLQLSHEMLFAPTEAPDLLRMITWLIRSHRRYQCAFTHRIPEAWDLELKIVTERISRVCAHDVSGASGIAAEGHDRLKRLLEEALIGEDFERFFRTADNPATAKTLPRRAESPVGRQRGDRPTTRRPSVPIR